MSEQYYNLTCNSYEQNLCSGFSNLQQNQEFVDMTLAADGYLIRVHKSVVALGSPYLKEMLSSVTCDHPIIILSNVNYEILTLIIEYIYTGEIQIPISTVHSFLKVAADLQLIGHNSFPILQTTVSENTMHSPVQLEKAHQHQSVNNTMPNIVIESNDTHGNQYYPETEGMAEIHNDNVNVDNSGATQISLNDMTMTDFHIYNSSMNLDTHENNTQNIQANINVTTDYKPQQYSVSSRGCLQLIMNRFIYLMHHTSHKGHKKRWRCSDYRRNSCKAYIDTEGDFIVKRINTHNHIYHDDKILKKVKQNLIYGSIKSIEVDRQEKKNKLNATVNETEES